MIKAKERVGVSSQRAVQNVPFAGYISQNTGSFFSNKIL